MMRFFRHWSIKQASGTQFATDSDVNKRLAKIEKKQKEKEFDHIQKQKLLKYKLKLLKQKNQLSKLQSLVTATNQNSSEPGTSTNELRQLDGNDTDSDISEVSDDDNDDDDDYVPPPRCTRNQASATSSNVKEKLLDSFAHFLDINNVTEDNSNDPLKVFSAFFKDSQKGKVTTGLKVKSTQLADESVSSHYQSALEDDDDEQVPPLVEGGGGGETATFKEAYVTAFELEIDSQPVDTLKITSTSDESCEAYFRFLGKRMLFSV